MSDEIILTKIAKLANEQQISSANNITLQYENKTWILLDNFKDDAKNLFQLLKTCKQI